MPSLANLDPTSTALVLIDLQQGHARSPMIAPLPVDQVVANAKRLVDAFHDKGAPVILVRVAFSPDGKDALHPDVDQPMVRRAQSPNWTDMVPELAPQPGDLVVTKRQWGAFYGTDLDMQLRRRGVVTIVLGGIATNYGVESTARDAYERGYQLVFALDAMTSRSATDHEFAVTRIFPLIGRVRETGDIIAALQS